MMIQIFDLIKQGIILSFKNKTILSLIALFLVLRIISIIFIFPVIVEQQGFKEMFLTIEMLNLSIGQELIMFFASLASVLVLFSISKAVFGILNKKKISVFRALISFKKFLLLFLAIILYFIIVLLGFVFLIIPGVFFFIKFLFFPFIILFKNKGIIASFKESWHMTKGIFWKIFFIFIILITILYSGLLIGYLFLDITTIIIAYIFFFFLLVGILMVIFTILFFKLMHQKIETDNKAEDVKIKKVK